MSREPSSPTPEALREKLAELCHEQWTGWMRYLFSRTTPTMGGVLITHEWVRRWQRQMDTPYAELSPREQDSDRTEADKFLALYGGERAQASTEGDPLRSAAEDAFFAGVLHGEKRNGVPIHEAFDAWWPKGAKR